MFLTPSTTLQLLQSVYSHHHRYVKHFGMIISYFPRKGMLTNFYKYIRHGQRITRNCDLFSFLLLIPHFGSLSLPVISVNAYLDGNNAFKCCFAFHSRNLAFRLRQDNRYLFSMRLGQTLQRYGSSKPAC